MKTIVTFLFLAMGLLAQAQAKIEGTVLNKKNLPMAGVNIYIDGTYDGATTGNDGKFSFETAETGAQVLVFTALFHADLKKDIIVLIGTIIREKTIELRKQLKLDNNNRIVCCTF